MKRAARPRHHGRWWWRGASRGATRRQGARDGSYQLPDLRPRLLPPDPPTQANPGYLAPRQISTRAAEASPPLHLLGPRAPCRRLRRARGRFGLRHHGDRPRARRRGARHAPPRQQSARAARPPRGRVLRRTHRHAMHNIFDRARQPPGRRCALRPALGPLSKWPAVARRGDQDLYRRPRRHGGLLRRGARRGARHGHRLHSREPRAAQRHVARLVVARARAPAADLGHRAAARLPRARGRARRAAGGAPVRLRPHAERQAIPEIHGPADLAPRRRPPR